MSTVLFKKYQLDRSENFDEFLKALGVNFLIRKMAKNVSSTVQLIKEDDGEDSYTFQTLSTFKNTVMKFKLGEEFQETTMDGRSVRCIITFEGNKMIQQQIGENVVRIEREFFDDQLIAKILFKDVIATRWFKAVDE